MLKSEVEPVVKQSLEKNKKGPKGNILPSLDFQFTKTDFGTIPPKISNMKTHKVDPEDMDGGTTRSIVIDFDVEYLGDCDIHVSLMGIGSGVRYEIFWIIHVFLYLIHHPFDTSDIDNNHLLKGYSAIWTSTVNIETHHREMLAIYWRNATLFSGSTRLQLWSWRFSWYLWLVVSSP